MNKKVILIILDGWGLGINDEVSAITKAKTPFMDRVLAEYPTSRLEASGLSVGLPEGQMGNSEVGHMNIGAGRVVYQDLVRINKTIEDQALGETVALIDAFDYAKANDKKVHFLGLLSDGGVHSHINHLKAFCSLAKAKNLEKVFIHAFTDGRDTAPTSGLGFMEDLQKHIENTNVKVASVTGRYYAMDRDRRWERVKLAYDALVRGEGRQTQNVLEAIQKSYDEGVTDEFIKPIVQVEDSGQALGNIENDDVVIFFNFRNDRARQLTTVLSQKDMPEFDMRKMNLRYLTLTNYDDTFKNVEVLFSKDKLENTLGEVLAKSGKKQIRIAETEKYPHVTFFFSGGREAAFKGEKRILCPSPKVATYDLQPEMSAEDIRNAIIPELEKQEIDFICLNFANPDMVGHTGIFEAAVKACETADACVKAVTEVALANDYTTIIIADHGNADIMVKADGKPHTAHTTNLVPCVLITKDTLNLKLKDGKLADIAPTILTLIGVDIPNEMNGKVLFE